MHKKIILIFFIFDNIIPFYVIFIIGFICATVQLLRKIDKNKEIDNKHLLTKSMDDKRRKGSQHIVPNKDRNASGCNWKTFKSQVIKAQNSQTKSHKKSVLNNRLIKDQKHKKAVHSANHDMNHIKNDEREKKITKFVAMDCEMVGIGNGTESMIARVSIVNYYGYCIYDKYVKPRERVQDYRTAISGIRPHHLESGEEFTVVQKEVAEILRGKILVGHAIKHDLEVLFLSHPRKLLRDTSRYQPFRKIAKGNTPSLKRLALELLGKEIQTGEHNSVEDARTAMQLYSLYKNQWESSLYSRS